MIPKIIHYCWFGGNPLPDDAKKCISSWKKYFPDYEITEWNETNFDLEICDYVKEAYQAKKWAFVSDYARFWILYHYGGLYFDTDVEIIKPLSDIVLNGNFMACELNFDDSFTGNSNQVEVVNPGLGIGAEAGLPFYRELLDLYGSQHFVDECGHLNFETIVTKTTRLLRKYGFRSSGSIEQIAGLNIYPHEYFCPINYDTNQLTITDKTVSIHHYKESWLSPLDKLVNRIEHSKKGRASLDYKIRRVISKPFRGLNRLSKKGINGLFDKH